VYIGCNAFQLILAVRRWQQQQEEQDGYQHTVAATCVDLDSAMPASFIVTIGAPNKTRRTVLEKQQC